MPEISVIVPVYNAEKYLRECLDSILAQTLRNFEVVCVDDGSTDGSLAILKEYAKRDARIKIIQCEHTNAGRCRNVGIAQTHGEYLLFLDADDAFASEMFETLLNAARETKADVAICGHAEFTDGNDFRRCLAFSEEPKRTIYREPSKNTDIFHWAGWPWDKLIARRIIDRYALSFQEQRTTNDLFFVYAALSVAETIVECPAPCVAYRKRVVGSLSATRNKSPRCFYDALVGYYDKMCALGIFPGNERLLKNFYAYSCEHSFWQLDTVAGFEATSSMFPLMKELCSRWNWCEILERDRRYPQLWQRCKSLSQANDVMVMYKSDITFFMKCYVELVEIKRSHAYRFAQTLVRLIRWYRR